MNQRDSTPPAGPLQRLAAPLGGWRVRLAVVLVLIAATAGGLAYAWRRWGSPATESSAYTLTAEKIETSPQPPWIGANVVEEIVRDGSLNGQSLLDPQLTARVAGAFRLHPWVREVRRVSKHYPARVKVELEYRRPVALAEVATEAARGVLPVDSEGIVLPRDDFVNEEGELIREALKYPVIVAGDSLPEGTAGAPWGDPRVAGAARIAAALGEAWRPLGLFKIAPASSREVSTSKPQEYVLLASGGSRVLWGASPGASGEDPKQTEAKIAALRDYVEQHGPLDQAKQPVEIDLRDPNELRVAPRAARRDDAG